MRGPTSPSSGVDDAAHACAWPTRRVIPLATIRHIQLRMMRQKDARVQVTPRTRRVIDVPLAAIAGSPLSGIVSTASYVGKSRRLSPVRGNSALPYDRGGI